MPAHAMLGGAIAHGWSAERPAALRRQAPRPWRWVRDELRTLDASHLLGMTLIDLPGLRGQAFPFLLERQA
ncbi:MAG: hypothetical protein JNN14_07800 [Comamonas sp.]|nr:hypothetical protein [Comamonas sp.]